MPKRTKTTTKMRDDIAKAQAEASAERNSLTLGLLGSKQQTQDEGFNANMMSRNGLLTPPYDPFKMYSIVESSGILPQCVVAMIQNIDGFGYELKYTGSTDDEETDEIADEKANLKGFFDLSNESESFRTLRMNVRRDIETTGNGYFEIIRFKNSNLAMIYHMDARYVRLQAKQDKAVPYTVKLNRNGRIVTMRVAKRFRRYAMLVTPKLGRLRWFKEFGDVRQMCAVTGKYADELGEGESIQETASEVLHFKIGHGAYGVPRWSGQVINALGMNSADFVNWDLFDNQVVPPLVVMVSGGSLTTESIRDIKRILIQKRGIANFNKVLILEATSEGNVTDKSQVKIELKEMSQARKEDAMFVTYLDKGEHRARSSFRLPPLYVGRADTYSKSTADSSKMIAEEQVFIPERGTFDEIVNVCLMPLLGAKNWAYSSKGPRLITGADMIDGFKEFSRAGVLTINEGIRLANRLLNMDVTLYDEAWADYPIPIVLELARLGMLKDIDAISSASEDLAMMLKNKTKQIPDGNNGDDPNKDPLEEEEDDDDDKATAVVKAFLAFRRKLSQATAGRKPMLEYTQEGKKENAEAPEV